MIRGHARSRTAVDTVIHRCLAVQAGRGRARDRRSGTRAIGEALREAAAQAGADAVLAMMDERATDGTDPARPIAAAISACDVFIAPTSRSLSHTPARKRAQRQRRARGDACPA